jgi:hypothetical protein
VLHQYEISGSGLLVVLEDDGRVAYAYLKDHGAIVADVWLYNVAEAPDQNHWRDKSNLPFLNPGKYCTAGPIPCSNLEIVGEKRAMMSAAVVEAAR